MEGLNDKEYKRILNPLVLQKDGMYGREDIENLIAHIYGTNAFESVTYRLEGDGEPYVLVLECQRGQTNEIGASIHVDTDEVVYVGSRLGIGTRKLYGPRLLMEMKIGTLSALNLEFAYKPAVPAPSVGIAWHNNFVANFESWDKRSTARGSFLTSRLDLFAQDSQMTYGDLRFGVSAEMEPYEYYQGSEENWKGWDWKSYWLSAFFRWRLDTLDDGYFPTRGFASNFLGRYVFNGYSTYLMEEGSATSYEGKVPPYYVGNASLTGAITLGQRFTIQPSVYFGYQSAYTDMVATQHCLVAGGLVPGRYMEYQIPFFGFSHGFYYSDKFAATAQLDLRYRLMRKNFITLKGGLFQDAPDIKAFTPKATIWAAGLEFGRKTMAGPVKFGTFWCSQTGWGVSFTFGMDF